MEIGTRTTNKPLGKYRQRYNSRGARMYDTQVAEIAGILNKFELDKSKDYKPSFVKQMRISDEQQFVNRFTWYNLPVSLNSNLMERILYYRGQLAFFYEATTDKYYTLPFALNGEIDEYGRFIQINPLSFNGTSETKKDKVFIPGLFRKCVYDVQDLNEPEEQKKSVRDNCVILRDCTQQISQHVQPRAGMIDEIIDLESNILCYLNTTLQNETGVKGMRVNDQGTATEALQANTNLKLASITGLSIIPIIGPVEFQDLMGNSSGGRAEEFLMSLQSMENYRLSTMGLNQGGLYEKKAHILQSEQDMNTSSSNLVLQDCLARRQEFCNIVNSCFGTSIWCEFSETVTEQDDNGDGMIEDNQEDPATEKGGDDNVQRDE